MAAVMLPRAMCNQETFRGHHACGCLARAAQVTAERHRRAYMYMRRHWLRGLMSPVSDKDGSHSCRVTAPQLRRVQALLLAEVSHVTLLRLECQMGVQHGLKEVLHPAPHPLHIARGSSSGCLDETDGISQAKAYDLVHCTAACAPCH